MHFFPKEQPRIENLLYFREKMISSKELQLFTIFETDAPGSLKTLSECRVSSDSSQVQAIFEVKT